MVDPNFRQFYGGQPQPGPGVAVGGGGQPQPVPEAAAGGGGVGAGVAAGAGGDGGGDGVGPNVVPPERGVIAAIAPHQDDVVDKARMWNELSGIYYGRVWILQNDFGQNGESVRDKLLALDNGAAGNQAVKAWRLYSSQPQPTKQRFNLAQDQTQTWRSQTRTVNQILNIYRVR